MSRPALLTIPSHGAGGSVPPSACAGAWRGRSATSRRQRQPADLDEAIEDRAELFQAQGMAMVQLGISIGEAMARLRAYAYAQDRRLSDVARDVVARRPRFDLDH
jgi:AmiR/NasT family two-component response regulator